MSKLKNSTPNTAQTGDVLPPRTCHSILFFSRHNDVYKWGHILNYLLRIIEDSEPEWVSMLDWLG